MDVKTYPAHIRGERLVLDVCEPEEPSGKYMVFTHGFTRARNQWEHAIQRAAERGYTGVAVDMRGHGDSSGEYSINEATYDNIEIAQRLKKKIFSREPAKKVYVLGYSAGGYVSLLSTLLEQDLVKKGVYPKEAIDGCYTIQMPRHPKDYEKLTYWESRLINPVTEMLMNLYPDAVENLAGGSLKLKKTETGWKVNDAHTRSPYAFRLGSSDSGNIVKYLNLVNGTPIRMVRSIFDYHVLSTDTKHVANLLKNTHNADVELGVAFFRDPTHDTKQYMPCVDDAINFFEGKQNGRRSDLTFAPTRKVVEFLDKISAKHNPNAAAPAA